MNYLEIIKIIEKALGVGVIPEGWKTAIAGFLVWLVATLEQFGVDVPDWIHDEWTVILAGIYMIAGLILKFTRPARDSIEIERLLHR